MVDVIYPLSSSAKPQARSKKAQPTGDGEMGGTAIQELEGLFSSKGSARSEEHAREEGSLRRRDEGDVRQ